ncbi:hypothetical protein HID58_056273, partial [Brassica napus]
MFHYHSLNPARSGGGMQKKKKMNNMVQFDQATNNKLRSESPVQV